MRNLKNCGRLSCPHISRSSFTMSPCFNMAECKLEVLSHKYRSLLNIPAVPLVCCYTTLL